MLSMSTRDDSRYVGFAPKVAYRVELGFALVDDGERLFRIQENLFEQILRNVRTDDRLAADEEFLSVLDRHPTIFAFFDDADTARASVDEREI